MNEDIKWKGVHSPAYSVTSGGDYACFLDYEVNLKENNCAHCSYKYLIIIITNNC